MGTNRSSGTSYTSYNTFLGTAGAPSRYLPYGEELTSTPSDHIKFGTYNRDSYTGLDYADQRFYASTYGRFMTPDPSAKSAKDGTPGSWNRYSYVQGDPVNRKDPRGLDICEDDPDYCDGFFTDPYGENDGTSFASPNCGTLTLDQIDVALGVFNSSSCFNFAATSVETSASPPKPTCAAANGLTNDQTAAVVTVMGENSNWLQGTQMYLPGASSGQGPTITRSMVYTEDIDMFSVFTNRAAKPNYPSTIGAVASQPGQFSAYGNGVGLQNFTLALESSPGSFMCNDLTDVVNAMNYVAANGSQLSPAYIYWKAINQGGGVTHQYQPGDIYVANTAFGIVNTN